MRLRRAVYGGSFDPITRGHEWLVEEALTLFDRLHVVVCDNPTKKHLFPLDYRFYMTRNELARHGSRVQVHRLGDRYLVHLAEELGATHLLRGVRTSPDLEVEQIMRRANDQLSGGAVRTLFMHPPRELEDVSSGLVRSLVGPRGWQAAVRRYVSPQVAANLESVIKK